MSLTPEEVNRIAHLARLGIDKEAVSKYAHELSNILTLVAQMDSADTSNTKPMAHPYNATQRLRPDQITEKDQRALFQSIAPDVNTGLYLVPQVIE